MRVVFLFIFLSLSGIAHCKQTVCLNMIVKNEKEVITRCLDSVKPLIDHWVIVDTGSTDGTQDVIRECLKDIPGELHESPWKNFAHNRNEALDYARDKADFILVMDADDYLEFPSGFSLPQLDKEAYHLQIYRDSVSFYRTQLISMTCPWRWVGVLHEYLTCDKDHTSQILEGVRYSTTHEGARSQDPQKYLKDAELLEAALEEEPANTRHVFYLAQSYKDAGLLQKALTWYQRRVEMGGWDQEVYWSFLQIAHLKKDLELSSEEVIDSYYRAFRYRPHRPEALYALATLFRQQNRNDLAYHLLKARRFIVQPVQKDILFVQDWIEEYGLSFELSICAYYVGEYQESLDLCDQLLALSSLPEGWRNRVEQNRGYPLEHINDAKCA